MYQQHSLDVFQHYFKKYFNAWFSAVRLIAYQSLLYNVICNRTSLNNHFLNSVWLSLRITRKCFAFNRIRSLNFKDEPTITLCQGGKTMNKQMFQWKTLFIRIFLLKWNLLKHLWKQKKMKKTYTRCWRRGWGIVEVSLHLWKKEIKNTKRETGSKMLWEQMSNF